MKIYDYSKQYASCAVCGDIHGEFDFLAGKIKRMELSDTLIIVAGDCGIGFDQPEYYQQVYQRIVKTLTKNNCGLLLVRGNHDDPEYFERELIAFPRMKTVPDYSALRFKDHTILCVGGAVSIDRRYRIDQMQINEIKGCSSRKLYWDNEAPQFSEQQMEAIKEQGLRIDTVVHPHRPLVLLSHDQKGNRNVDGLRSESGQGYRRRTCDDG